MVRMEKPSPVRASLPQSVTAKSQSPSRFRLRQEATKRVPELMKPHPHRIITARGPRVVQLHKQREQQGVHPRDAKGLLCPTRRMPWLSRLPAQMGRPLTMNSKSFTQKSSSVPE